MNNKTINKNSYSSKLELEIENPGAQPPGFLFAVNSRIFEKKKRPKGRLSFKTNNKG